jgi:triosephosphate isomerase
LNEEQVVERRSIVAGNWKMNNTVGAGVELASEIRRLLAGEPSAEAVLCPPFTALHPVGDVLRASRVALGAQDVHWEPEGAFTGEISVPMLKDLGCVYVIVGHSERRTLFHETDADVRRKVEAILGAGLRPIVCVGETLEQREAGVTEDVVRGQVENGLRGLGRGLGEVVIAYEPVWAIGTGKTATPEQVQQVHAFIRGLVGGMAGAEIAAGLRIQYGGSVKPSNAAELFALPDVDGGLIGGACLTADSFAAIVTAAG